MSEKECIGVCATPPELFYKYNGFWEREKIYTTAQVLERLNLSISFVENYVGLFCILK